MKTWMRLVFVFALASMTNLSCSVNDYCLNCEKGDGGHGSGDDANDGGGGSGSDGGVDAGCIPTGGPEECNGKDDDCNGLIDDGIPVGVGDPCQNQMGACAGGTQVCTNGQLKCNKQPQPEICDGIDNNCSGAVDEGDPGGGAKCGTDQGECVAGQFHCDPPTGTLKCFGFVDHTGDPELCDGKDNDCDGNFDENIGSLGTCGPSTNVGECNQGTLLCMGGQPVCGGVPGPIFPKFEICNGLDDNCDGNIDEIFNKTNDPNNCGSCGMVCAAHAHANTVCTPTGTPPTTGTCGYTCKPGFHDIVPGGGANDGCEYGPCFATGVEECDNIDNDCDGVIDEGLTPPPICKGLGECGTSFGVPGAAGYKVSSPPTATCGGAAGWTCTYPGIVQFPETRCDGLDNNCDGNNDENQPNLGQSCHEDRENPATQCGADTVDDDGDGKVNDGCDQVGAAAESGVQCANAIDDDGDGAINDGCPAVSQLGVCQGSGTIQCDTRSEATRNGPAFCSITTPGSAPSAEACDNKDNNCNGQTDEGGNTGSLVGQDWVPLGNGLQMMQYEASKPDATSLDAGSVTTIACSKAGALPWVNVKYQDAAAACASIGASLCSEQNWHRACSVVTGQTYNPSLSNANIGNATGLQIEAEDYSHIAYGGVAETTCNESVAVGGVDEDKDGVINDGCPVVGVAELNCRDGIDDDGDGFINDGCPTVGPAFVPDSTAGFSGISAMEATPNLGANPTIANALTQSARLDFRVVFPATSANEHVWVRIFANNGNDNSVYVGITDLGVAPPATPAPTPLAPLAAHTVTVPGNVAQPFGTWLWMDAGAFSVTTGRTGLVSIFMAKDGVKVDRIFLVAGGTTPSAALLAPTPNKWAFTSAPNTYATDTCNGHDYQTVNITNAVRTTAGLTTITAAGHPFVVGSLVQISGTTIGGGSLDGVYTVSARTATTFSYQQNTTAAVTSAASAGTATEARDPVLPTKSLANCAAALTGGNVFDLSGNAREWTLAHSPGENPVRGGASNGTADGISCPLNFTLADDTFFFPNIGFRCCRPPPP